MPKYYWLNTFNMIECGGPFDTVEAAKADAEKVYIEIQDGLALSVDILESDLDKFDFTSPGDVQRLLKTGPLVAEGHIDGGHWAAGYHPRQQAVS